jgi:hypothetical protein
MKELLKNIKNPTIKSEKKNTQNSTQKSTTKNEIKIDFIYKYANKKTSNLFENISKKSPKGLVFSNKYNAEYKEGDVVIACLISPTTRIDDDYRTDYLDIEKYNISTYQKKILLVLKSAIDNSSITKEEFDFVFVLQVDSVGNFINNQYNIEVVKKIHENLLTSK